MSTGIVRLFVGLLAVYLAMAGGHLYTADDWSRFHAARSFLLHLSPELPDKPYVYGVTGSGGRIVSHFPPGLSMAVLPLLAAGHAAGRLVPSHQEHVERTACSLLNQAVVAWLMILLYRVMGCAGIAPRRRLHLVLLAAFGSLAFPYAKHFWAEPLQAALLVAAILTLYRLQGGDRRVRDYAVFSAALAGALLVKYETVAPAAVMSGGLLLVAPPRGGARWVGVVAPWAAVVVVLGAYNLWRFGSPFDMGYGGLVMAQSATDVVEAAALNPLRWASRAAMLLVSPGQGLFVFVPVAAVAFVRALCPPRDRVLGIGYAAGFSMLALYVALDRSSTWCWGPRYMFSSMILWWPALGFLSGRAWRLAGVLGAAGVVVALLGVLVNFHDAIEEIKTTRGFGGWEWVAHVQREPALSPVIWHARLVGPYLKRTVDDGLERGGDLEPPVTWRHRHVDILWFALWAGGLSPIILAIPVVLLGLGSWHLATCGRRLS
ncbi:hypothetical protein JXA88_13370 [Candidatus Fermentibacteria bacterium]|nr:hypothetical protein [Candidatus Fermentibacteria bacterium]